MTDGIIKGTGNSRFLKVPPNALTLYPTWEAAAEAMIAGTFPIDLNGVNPAGWDVQGDKLNKATLLTDALCTALGLPDTATPAQAMEKLRQLVNTAQSGVDNGVKIASGFYIGDGDRRKTLTFPFSPKFISVGFQYLMPLNGHWGDSFISFYPEEKIYSYSNSYGSLIISISFESNQITYFTDKGNSVQAAQSVCNTLDRKYEYLCIG